MKGQPKRCKLTAVRRALCFGLDCLEQNCMNIRETAAYLNKVGLELSPSRLKNFRWALSVSGDEPWTHFETLAQLWRHLGRWALARFREELAADEILKACDAGIGSRWALLDAWLENDTRRLPKFTHKIIDEAEATLTELPPKWQDDYARLIQPYGALYPYEPILGYVLQSKLIALKAKNSALCRPRRVESQHVKSRRATVDRDATEQHNRARALS